MIETLKSYFAIWWTVMARPIWFYTKLKEENWQEKSLTFLLITAWILAVAITMMVFLTQYWPIGATLVEGISGFKFIIILPVLITLAISFFLITLLIIGGLAVLGLGAAFYLIGACLHYTYIILGGRGSLNRMIQCSFYSSAVALAGVLPAVLILLTRLGWLEFSLFRVGYNIFFVLTLLYAYGLWAIAGRKIYNISKPLALTGALVPVLLLLIFGFLFDKIGIRKLEKWITPLK